MTFTEQPFWILTAIVFLLWLVFRRDYCSTLSLFLAGSVVFYGYHCWPLLFLLLTYCLLDWLVGIGVESSNRPRLWLTFGVAFNLLVLGYWKYTPLLLRTFGQPVPQGWAIPFGISFYAFTGIAYMVDVYRKVVLAERSFWRYTLSAMFFPHLVAGPILRPDEFLSRLRPDTLPRKTETPREALLLLGRGLFRKMVLANSIALGIDPFFTHLGDSSTAGVWSLPFVYLYALQIYFDFAGYTDIARGLGMLFGFRWPENFERPYLSASIQDFWRRWHMTLSRFLKDYLYIPLGGSRHGSLRTSLNLMLTMVLGGLWHGASWSFTIWGGLHGLFLVVNRLWASTPVGRKLRQDPGWTGRLWQFFCLVLTFHCVCAAWCFFRLTDWTQSLTCLRMVFSFDGQLMFPGAAGDVSLWLLLGAYSMKSIRFPVPAFRHAGVAEQPSLFTRGFQWGTAAALVLLALLLSPGGEAPPFIYFQF